jgi:hypothetical protein
MLPGTHEGVGVAVISDRDGLELCPVVTLKKEEIVKPKWSAADDLSPEGAELIEPLSNKTGIDQTLIKTKAAKHQSGEPMADPMGALEGVVRIQSPMELLDVHLAIVVRIGHSSSVP